MSDELEKHVRASFARQAAMQTLGVSLESVEPGRVVLALPFREDLTQQHGFLHAGVVTTALDSACGYAALTMMEPGSDVLSVEFKVNLLAPARGRYFRAVAQVARAGRTLTVVTAEMRAYQSDEGNADHTVTAIMTATMMAMRERPGSK